MSLAKAMAARQRAYGRRGARWFDISIKGERELMKTFDKMSRRFGNAVTLPILLEGAVIVGDEIERRAPQQEGRWLRAGRSGGAIFDERGGNLKGGIVAAGRVCRNRLSDSSSCSFGRTRNGSAISRKRKICWRNASDAVFQAGRCCIRS